MPLPALAIPAIIQGGVGAAQFLYGLFNRGKRPKYEISSAVRQGLSISKAEYADKLMPGYTQAAGSIEAQTSNLANLAAISGNPGTALPGIVAAHGTAMRGLAAQNAQQQNIDRLQLGRSLNEFASEERLAFQMNEFAPFVEKRERSNRMIGGGLNNLFSGINTMAAAGVLKGFGGSQGANASNNAPGAGGVYDDARYPFAGAGVGALDPGTQDNGLLSILRGGPNYDILKQILQFYK